MGENHITTIDGDNWAEFQSAQRSSSSGSCTGSDTCSSVNPHNGNGLTSSKACSAACTCHGYG